MDHHIGHQYQKVHMSMGRVYATAWLQAYPSDPTDPFIYRVWSAMGW